jgi:glycosyltransferase involved in cell wall biosynthesis
MDFTDVQSLMVGSRLLVVPSIWFEGYPMVIREAFALGVPVAASDLGSLADLVDESVGRRFRPGDPADLLDVVRQLWSEVDSLASMSLAARARYERDLAPAPNIERLMAIYAAARTRRAARTGGRQTGTYS